MQIPILTRVRVTLVSGKDYDEKYTEGVFSNGSATCPGPRTGIPAFFGNLGKPKRFYLLIKATSCMISACYKSPCINATTTSNKIKNLKNIFKIERKKEKKKKSQVT